VSMPFLCRRAILRLHPQDIVPTAFRILLKSLPFRPGERADTMDTLPLGFAEPAEHYEPSTADRIARGVCRKLGELGYRSLLEFRVGLGRRADVAALGATGRFVIVEIQRTLAHFPTAA